MNTTNVRWPPPKPLEKEEVKSIKTLEYKLTHGMLFLALAREPMAEEKKNRIYWRLLSVVIWNKLVDKRSQVSHQRPFRHF